MRRLLLSVLGPRCDPSDPADAPMAEYLQILSDPAGLYGTPEIPPIRTFRAGRARGHGQQKGD